MDNFFKIASGVDTLPLLAAIYRQPELWDENNMRTRYEESPHREAQDIWLWFNEVPDDDPTKVVNDIQTYPFDAWEKLPQARPIVFDLLRRVEGVQLGRCVITKLAPGKRIYLHTDEGAPAEFYNRFQVPLQAGPGCIMTIEDESLQMQPGEVWMIDNRKEHEVVNNSSIDRIAMVVDVRCA